MHMKNITSFLFALTLLFSGCKRSHENNSKKEEDSKIKKAVQAVKNVKDALQNGKGSGDGTNVITKENDEQAAIALILALDALGLKNDLAKVSLAAGGGGNPKDFIGMSIKSAANFLDNIDDFNGKEKIEKYLDEKLKEYKNK